jgi:hypothetical protein
LLLVVFCAGQPAQRRDHQKQGGEECNESPHGRLVRHGLAHRKINDEREHDRHHDLHQRDARRRRRRQLHIGTAHLVRAGIEARPLVVLPAEYLDHAVAADRLLQRVVEVTHRGLLGPAHAPKAR